MESVFGLIGYSYATINVAEMHTPKEVEFRASLGKNEVEELINVRQIAKMCGKTTKEVNKYLKRNHTTKILKKHGLWWYQKKRIEYLHKWGHI